MSIEIGQDTEEIISELLVTGRFGSADEVIRAGVEALRERHNSQATASADARKAKAREFVEWARSHRETPPLPDEAISRAALNPDRW